MGRIGSVIRFSTSLKNACLVGRLGSEPRLVCRTGSEDNNNNNNNNHDNVYGAFIMAEPLREFTRFI